MAAAASGSRVRRQKQAETNARIREQLSHKRRALKERTGEFFDEMSPDGQWIRSNQVHSLLAKAMRENESKLDADAIQLVIDTTHKMQQKEGLDAPSDMPGAVHKEPLLDALDKYGEYVKNRKAIDEIYEKYDKNNDGVLSKKELWKCLQAYERKATRAKSGIVITLMVEEADVDWIMKECDADNNGTISHAEYLPAVSAWEELAQLKLENPGPCCIIL